MTESAPDIGSEFEAATELLLTSEATPPWEVPGETIVYVESGRQALAAVAEHLTRLKIDRLITPSHYCESMVEPFLRQGIHLHELPPTGRYETNAEDLRRASNAGACAVLHAPYFGCNDSSELTQLLDAISSQGIPVINDVTHALFSPHRRSEIRVASLRKLLPVPDGGFVSGIDGVAVHDRSGIRASDLRSRAMAAKSEYINGELTQRTNPYRDLYRQAEDATERDLEATSISWMSHMALRRFDYARIASTRIENASTLVAALTVPDGWHISVATPPQVPAWVVVRGPRAELLQKILASRRVFCPMHWPKPTWKSAVEAWISDGISLPVDSRYGPGDMRRLAHHLHSAITQLEETA